MGGHDNRRALALQTSECHGQPARTILVECLPWFIQHDEVEGRSGQDPLESDSLTLTTGQRPKAPSVCREGADRSGETCPATHAQGAGQCGTAGEERSTPACTCPPRRQTLETYASSVWMYEPDDDPEQGRLA